MNILQINTIDNIGGAAKVCYRLHKGFKKKRHKSFLLTGVKTASDVFIKELKPQKESFVKQFLYQQINPDGFLLYKNRILKEKIINKADIINLHNLHGGYFKLSDLKKLSQKKPIVWTLHDMWSFTGHCAYSYDCQKWQTGCSDCPNLSSYPKLKHDLAWLIWEKKKKIYNSSNFTLIVPSRWLMEKIKKSILKDKKTVLIYNGIDEKIFKPYPKIKARKELNLPLNKEIICFVAHGGFFTKRKGKEIIKKILNKIQQRKNTLILEIGTIINQKEKSPYIFSIPYIKKEKLLAKYYNASDIFLFTSLADNCPLVVLEAMASSLPVITFNTGGIPEIVEHLKTGYVAKYKDASDLCKGLSLFLDNPRFIKNSSLRARKRIEKNFTLTRQTSEYLKLYHNLLER